MTRKPKDRLTLVKGLAIAREKGMDEICVGQALALQYWMERLELNAPQLAARRGSCPTSIYQVLKLEWAPSSPWWNVTAKALGMELWQFDMDAELLLQGKQPVPHDIMKMILEALRGVRENVQRSTLNFQLPALKGRMRKADGGKVENRR
jgi:hypothetical protein